MLYRLGMRRVFRATAAGLILLAACGGRDAAQAQGKLDARYAVTLAGIPIGQGNWVLDIADDQYTAAASGATTGLLRMFSGGKGSSAARGTLNGGQSVAATFASTIITDKKTDEVRMVVNSGTVKEYSVDPPSPPNPDRVPITEADRRGVTDPMTASLIRVSGNGDPLTADACQRNTAVFDGRMRYDLQLAFKRMDKIKTEKGYQGPVAVCSVQFTPLAGHIPDRAAIKYLTKLRDMEVWLAPVAGTRVVVPIRVSIPTPLGLGVLEATQFVSNASSRPTSASMKTQ